MTRKRTKAKAETPRRQLPLFEGIHEPTKEYVPPLKLASDAGPVNLDKYQETTRYKPFLTEKKTVR